MSLDKQYAFSFTLQESWALPRGDDVVASASSSSSQAEGSNTQVLSNLDTPGHGLEVALGLQEQLLVKLLCQERERGA